MENIIKELREYICVFSITGLYFKIEIRDKLENRLILDIYCNFNKKRNSFSYVDYKNRFDKRTEIYVSKKKLTGFIKDFKKRSKI